MKRNIGKIDEYIRYSLGVILIIVSFYTTLWLNILALILIVTAYRKTCLLYDLFNFTTYKKEQ